MAVDEPKDLTPREWLWEQKRYWVKDRPTLGGPIVGREYHPMIPLLSAIDGYTCYWYYRYFVLVESVDQVDNGDGGEMDFVTTEWIAVPEDGVTLRECEVREFFVAGKKRKMHGEFRATSGITARARSLQHIVAKVDQYWYRANRDN